MEEYSPSEPAPPHLAKNGPVFSDNVATMAVDIANWPGTDLNQAAVMFARTEATIPAPESAHAIRAAIDEALDAKAKDEQRIILFNLSGHGHLDMAAYDAYLGGQLQDYEMSDEELRQSLATLPQVTEPAAA